MKSSPSSPSWSFLAMISMTAVVFSDITDHRFGSWVVAFQTQLPLRPNSRAAAPTNSVAGTTSSNLNFCDVESNSRRVRCTAIRRGGSVGGNTRHSRGLPLAAAASSSEDDAPTKKRKKRATKSKAKRKTKAKAKAKTAVVAAIAEEKEVAAPVGAEVVSDEGVEIVHISDMPVVVVRDSDKTTIRDGDEPYAGPQPKLPDTFQFDLTGGRPGTIIESEIELEQKDQIMKEMDINDASETGRKKYPKWLKNDYGFLQEDADAEYDNDDPEAIDGSTLGDYDITDLNTKFDWEWDPKTDDDPNLLETQLKNDILPSGRYLAETEKDEEGIEVGFDSLYGVSNPIDERTKIGTIDSYMVDENTRNEEMLTPEFFPDDPEKAYNEEIVQYRKSMDIIETYQDEFLPENMPVPRNVAKWYGYPEELSLPPKNYTNNRFTKTEDLTDFDDMSPFRARQRAVELARSNNAEWMPDGVSQAWHQQQRQPYEVQGTLIGTLRKGHCDPETHEMIKPALQVLGSCAELLSIEGEANTIFRFHYHGLMKNKYGMSCWTETLIRDCGADVTGVVFETGFRARDPAYDGGFPYHGWE
uniref:Uncharacterized protein n=1 Tax=Pseudo-nitzschia australis TaxID=44445 RepID=A0A7S4AT75_9STRA|mmetsp:Transcript_25743/g.56463  ORF Transcript_25743/g.56463 Transcript_25743/m.56463 type:complete len:585 (+) Transcript_25743:115-1869(+)